MEHWIELNLFAERRDQNRVLLDFIMPYVQKLGKNGTLVTFHFFRESLLVEHWEEIPHSKELGIKWQGQQRFASFSSSTSRFSLAAP